MRRINRASMAGSHESTFEYKGVNLTVGFYYQPYEPAETGPEAQYPGCPEAHEIESIYIDEIDVFELLEDQAEEIEEALIEHLKNTGI